MLTSVAISTILTDEHRNRANEVKVDYKGSGTARGRYGTVCTSITSRDNGTDCTTDPTMTWNTHLKFYSDNRGT